MDNIADKIKRLMNELSKSQENEHHIRKAIRLLNKAYKLSKVEGYQKQVERLVKEADKVFTI